jgi:hypothetical protein
MPPDLAGRGALKLTGVNGLAAAAAKQGKASHLVLRIGLEQGPRGDVSDGSMSQMDRARRFDRATLVRHLPR